MADFTLSFDTTNEAFDYDRLAEVARILRHAADLVLSGGDTSLRDFHGNTVGSWSLSPAPDEG